MIDTTSDPGFLAAIFPHDDDHHLERRLIRTDPFLDDFVPNEYTSGVYREVQLDFTPEMEVVNMLFERCHTKIQSDSSALRPGLG